MKAKESRNRNLMQLSEQSLEQEKASKEESRNFIIIFLFNKTGENVKPICACTMQKLLS
jgi:hypothetical protein